MLLAAHQSIWLPRRSRHGRRAIVRALGAGTAALAWNAALAQEARPIRSLGVFPYLPALKIGELYAPAALDLGDALDVQIELRTKDTFADYALQLAAGVYDIVVVHPFLYVDGHDRQGYRAVAQVDQELRAVLVGRRHEPVDRLADLRGETIAMVPLTAVAQMLRLAMTEEGLADGTDIRLQPHQTKLSCLQAVAAGDALGCVVPSTLGGRLPDLGKLDLAPIWRSRPIGGSVIAVHPRMQASGAERLRRRLIGWSGTPQGRTILHGLAWPRVRSAEDEDFEPVRAMRARLRAVDSG